MVPPEQQGDPATVRRAVLVALMTTDTLPLTFTRIVAGFQRAAGMARDLDAGLAPLADALLQMAQDARARGSGMAAHYRDLGEQAAKLLISGPKDGRS